MLYQSAQKQGRIGGECTGLYTTNRLTILNKGNDYGFI